MGKRSPELEKKIIELYQSGLSMAKVGKEVGRSAAVVLAVLNKYNIPKRTKGGIYQLPTEEIINKYVQDKRTMESIGQDYGVTLGTIKKILIENNITIRTSAESRNPFFNENAFENIDNEAAAYFLGLLITDGNVQEPDLKNSHPNYRINLELQSNDRYILEKLKEFLRLTSVNIYDAERIKNNSISKTSSLSWYSTKMAKDLEQYGVVPRKTNSVYLPQLRKDLMPHLIRGMIDGDGSLTITHTHNKPHLVIYFCGNQQCVTQLRDYLVNILDLYNVKVVQASENLWQISWASKKDCLKICDYLYKDANYFLTRKKEKYLYALNDYENTEVI